MKIETAKRRRVQDGFRKNEAIGDHNSDIGPKACKLVLDLGAAKAFGREHPQTGFLCEAVHRRFSGFHPAPGRPGRLCVNRHDIMARSDDFAESRDRKIRGSHEHNPQRHG